MSNVRILTLDIECMANLLWSWQVRSNNDWSATSVEHEWYPLGVGYKWYDEEEAHYLSLEKYKGYKPSIRRYKDGSLKFTPPNLKPMMKDAWELLNTADVVVGWNSTSFDIKKLNDWFVKLGMSPYMPIMQVDVMREKKKITSSNSNKLDDTSEAWGTGRKQKHEGWDLWIKCCEGDPKALADMESYCKQDVLITEKNYDYLKPWIKTHPKLNVLDERPTECPKGCGGEMMAGMKYTATSTNKYQYFRCNNCGGVAKARIPEKLDKPLYT